MTKYLIPSTAHEVVQAFPFQSGPYVCLACGKRGNVHALFHSDCIPKWESETSGWRSDQRYPVLRLDKKGRIAELIYHMDGLA